MKRNTFVEWLRRYAKAYAELQMAGSLPDNKSQKEHISYWRQEQVLAFNKLIGVWTDAEGCARYCEIQPKAPDAWDKDVVKGLESQAPANP